MHTEEFEKGLVSVIIPVYNTEKYIDRCLESVTEQSYGNIEIILIEDGSSDNSREKCFSWAKKDGRIKVFTQENSGVCKARNRGLEVCRGEYIGFIDSDDKIGKDMVGKLVTSIEENEADLAVCAFYNIYSNRTLKASLPGGIITGTNIPKSIFLPGFFLLATNKIFKRELLIGENGDFIKFSSDIYISEDSLWLSEVLLHAEKAVYVDTPFYYWYRRCDSATQGSPDMVRLDEKAMTEITAFERVAENCKKAGPDVFEEANKRLFLIMKKKLFAAYGKKDKELVKELNGKIKSLLKIYRPKNNVDRMIIVKFRFMRLLCKMNIDAGSFKLFSKRPKSITRDSSMDETDDKID